MGYVYNVGINDVKGSSTHFHKEYLLWKNMLKRCYSGDYPSYSGCSVCDRWKVLSNFMQDIKSLQNYDKWKSGGNYVLDKDIIPGVKGTLYSPHTCYFATFKDNQYERNIRCIQNLIDSNKKRVSVNGVEYESTTEAERVLGVPKGTVSKYASGYLNNYCKKYNIKCYYL